MAAPLEIGFQFRNRRFTDAEQGLRALGRCLETATERLGPILRGELDTFLRRTVANVSDRHGKGYPGGTTSNSLSVRSGKGLQSLKDGVKIEGDKLSSVQGSLSAAAYMKTHETGAVLKPKKSKYLTIPLPAALNPNGTPKLPSARDWNNTFVATSKKGNLIIFQRQGRKIVPLYVLKSSVTIPARLGLGKELEDGVPSFVDTSMDKMVRGMLDAL